MTRIATHAYTSFLVGILVCAAVPQSSAQVATGTPAFGSFGGGPFDTVNLGNLNVHFVVPIVHKAGRGMAFNYSLSYDSSVWSPALVSGQNSWQPAFNWGWTAQTVVNTGYLTYDLSFTNCDDDSGHQSINYIGWGYHDPWGIVHNFSGIGLHYDPYDCEFGTRSSATELATDNSGLELAATLNGDGGLATHTITIKSGTVLNPPVNLAGGYSGVSTSVTDANGNEISVSSTSDSATFTDTLGTTAVTVSGTSPVTFSYTAPSGAAANYTMNYQLYTVATDFGISTIKEYGPLSISLVSYIALPDDTKTSPDRYTFTYEKTPGTCKVISGTYSANCVTGRIASVTLPAGGVITYTYSGGSNGIFSDGSTAGLTRMLSPTATCSSTQPSGCWEYARTLVTGTPGTGSTWTTSIVDPTGNNTVVNFAEDGYTTNPSYNFYETQRQVYQGSVALSNLLATAIKCYNKVYAACATATVSSPISQTDFYSELPNNSTRLSEVVYNTYGLVTDDKEYKYGVTMGAAPGPTDLIRETAISYASLGNGIVNKPSSVIVYDWTSSSSKTLASTAYTYDQGTPTGTPVCPASGCTPQHIGISGSRGLLTTLATSTSSTTSLTKTFTYYDTGNPNVVTDVNGAQTTYTYSSSANPYNTALTASCGNSFATTINEPLSLSRSMQWNCIGGIAEQTTDENTQTVKSTYSDANFWRPASVYDQEKNETTIAYSGETAVEAELSFNNNTQGISQSVSDVRTTVDGFGRPILSQRLQGPSAPNYDTAETDYNNLGQPSRSTMPFSAAAGGTSSTAPATNTTYDALGRVLSVIDADGGTVSYTYTNNDVLQQVSGGSKTQAFQKQFEYDGLGRLTSVCELSSVLTGNGTCGQSTTQTGFWTKYTYDALGHLLTVTQNAQAAAASQQTRAFTYDWLGRMTSESNPETSNTTKNGTKTYVYDASSAPCNGGGPVTFNGDLIMATDAAGKCALYFYDALHRVTDVGNNNQTTTNACKRFRYDNSSGYSGSTKPAGLVNTLGRLIEVATDACISQTNDALLTDEWFSYSPRGELTDVYEFTPNSGGYYHTSASYWPTGTLNSLSAFNSTPAAFFPTIYYGASGAGLDGEGRITQVTAASGTGPVSSVTYSTTSTTNPLGSLTAVTFGSADSDSFTYDPNTGRMTGYSFSVNSQTDGGALTWNANGTLNQLKITDGITGTTDSQTCNYLYDDFQRLSSANCGALWTQNFTYDPFGNITKSGSSAFDPTYSPTQNQFTTIPGRNVSYDGAGNLLTDNLNTYTWDVYGNMSTVNTGSATVTATYDGLGRMVENNAGGKYTQIIYGPNGKKLATANGQTLVKAFIALPGGAKAIYNSTGLAYYRYSDWLGSSRLTSTATKPTSMYSSTAYAPFGDVQANQTTGTTDASFTGQDQDTVSSLYDFTFRRYSPSQGRWISPDPAGTAAVSLSVPQSWNRYGYAYNNPLALIDPTGLDPDCGPDELGGSQCWGQSQGTDSTNASSGTDPGDGIVLGGGDGPPLPSTGDPITPTVPGTSVTVYGTSDPVEGTVVDVAYSLADNVPFGQIFTLTGAVRGPTCTNCVMADCGAANNGTQTPQQTARQKCLSQAYNAPEGKTVQFVRPVLLTPLGPEMLPGLAVARATGPKPVPPNSA